MIDYCRSKASFEESTISSSIHLDQTNRILQEDVKGLGGSEAANKIRDRLISAFHPDEVKQGFNAITEISLVVDDDIVETAYSAAISYAEAVAGLRRHQVAWSIIKLYYSTFYCLARSNAIA
jgi:hypothetical protein